MRRVRRRFREFHVGTLRRRDSADLGLVVLDPSVQTDGGEDGFVTLFEIAENQSGQFRAAVVWRLLGPPDQFSQAEIERAVDAYCHSAGIDPEAEWLDVQRGEAGLSRRVTPYPDLRASCTGRELSYEELLCTPDWLAKRGAILARDGYRCTSCSLERAAGERRVVLQVH